MTAPLYAATGTPAQGSKGQSKAVRDEFAAIETAMDKLNAIPLFCYASDINFATGDSFWMPTPGWAGTISSIFAVNYVANTVGATGITVEIGGAAVTLGGTLEWGASDAEGTQITQTATANNAFTAGQPIEIISDGGGAAIMPAMICALIARTS